MCITRLSRAPPRSDGQLGTIVVKRHLDYTIQHEILKEHKMYTDLKSDLIKANMNSDIPLQTAAISFSDKLYLKQGIG